MARNGTEQVRQLQRTLYRTAKQSKAVKFYSLYDKVWRILGKPTFTTCSYGYRPRRDAKMASKAIRNDLYRGAWSVVEIDFRSYVTTIPHDKLMILIKQRVVDGSMLRLIKQSLRVEIAYEGKVEPTTVGVPQGSPISERYHELLRRHPLLLPRIMRSWATTGSPA